MKTLKEILLESSPVEKTQLKMIIDKTIPFTIVDSRLDMLKNRNPKSLLSLLKINHMFKTYLLAEVMLVEDMLLTGIYNSDFAHKTYDETMKESIIFPRHVNSMKKQQFSLFIKKQAKLKHIPFDTFRKKTLLSIFKSLTLGGKILFIDFLDRDVVSFLLVSNRTKHTKKELINALEYSKRLRNHVAHNFFVLNKGPYIRMVPKNKQMGNDGDIINFLFSNLENILKISSRGPVLNKIKLQIRKGINEDIGLKHISCILLK